MANQTTNGKAFEYACLTALREDLVIHRPLMVVEDKPFFNAQRDFFNLSEKQKDDMLLAARAARKLLYKFEPRLLWGISPSRLLDEDVTLQIQSDKAGQNGDVRDVICAVEGTGWSIGLSCKNNHDAAKHPRLSQTIDFGMNWFNHPCSEDYFNAISPIFAELKEIQSDSHKQTLWSSLEHKAERFYIPILKAFSDELRRLAATRADTPLMLIRYLLGSRDFYKVMKQDKTRSTIIRPVNLGGTLAQKSGRNSSRVHIGVPPLPSRIYDISFKNEDANSAEVNTILVTLDEGWQVSLRIHNASSRVEPSLKFDVKLVSQPADIYSYAELWEDE